MIKDWLLLLFRGRLYLRAWSFFPRSERVYGKIFIRTGPCDKISHYTALYHAIFLPPVRWSAAFLFAHSCAFMNNAVQVLNVYDLLAVLYENYCFANTGRDYRQIALQNCHLHFPLKG
jgi:hypothetical protein